MSATKQEVRKKTEVRYWIITIGTILFYAVCCALIIIFGFKNYSPVTSEEETDILQIIWDSLGNAGTLIPLVVDFISAMLLKRCKKQLSYFSIITISATGFFLYCFYSIFVRHHIHPVLVAFVGFVSFLVCIILVLTQPSNIVIKQGSIIRAAIGNKIKNAKIAGIQVFECTMTEDRDSVNYAIHSIDHLSNDSNDINGMLSVAYKLKKDDVNRFDFVTKTYYQTLVESANDNTKDDLIELIDETCSDIKRRLQGIHNVADVSKDDCCLARLMVMYNAYLKILKPRDGETNMVPDSYIGEQDFQDGDLGVDIGIEKRLFTLIRTGLLGGLLVGPNCIYNFQYRKDGYKIGRQYCVFHLNINEGDSISCNRIFLCLVVLKEGSMTGLPPYVLQAIRKMIPLLENTLRKSVQEVNV